MRFSLHEVVIIILYLNYCEGRKIINVLFSYSFSNDPMFKNGLYYCYFCVHHFLLNSIIVQRSCYCFILQLLWRHDNYQRLVFVRFSQYYKTFQNVSCNFFKIVSSLLSLIVLRPLLIWYCYFTLFYFQIYCLFSVIVRPCLHSVHSCLRGLVSDREPNICFSSSISSFIFENDRMIITCGIWPRANFTKRSV